MIYTVSEKIIQGTKDEDKNNDNIKVIFCL